MIHTTPLAMVQFTPLMIAALMAWILCVCIHEFSHALVAYIGGDRSVREKGYLSLDPTKFIDPVFSLLIPAVILMLGGLPLAGGSVRIDERALKNRRWRIYVAAAGPASNFLLFLAFGAMIHPSLPIVDHLPGNWTHFCGAMAVLNFIGAFFNLIPVPPLDGYRIIEHQFSQEFQWKMRQPQNAMGAFGLLFLTFWMFPKYVFIPFIFMLDLIATPLGIPQDVMWRGYDVVLFNHSY